ncbi:hypothetical protein A1359_13745 [Methylomonas lenta]|uniref:Uncharacterized protein n=1 Tax=Methylomonas lenta TaxID=980561 RepID=A0A177N421_9GAMM|nr:hypothetical protein [Methylomonas lenta]OAI12595.1 hypothetical protein A1359_13745 [Methylomonas lenta]
MNLSHKTYTELKQDAQTVRQAIIDKQAERQAIADDIAILSEKIDNLSRTLQREEHAAASASRLKQPTMTALEFIAHRKELEAMRAELPGLNEAVAFLDRFINEFHGQLRLINSWQERRIQLSSKDLAPQLAARIADSLGDDFKLLVAAVVVSNEKSMGYSLDVKSLFFRETSISVFNELLNILTKTEGYQLPDLNAAKQCVAEQLEAVA